MFFVRPGIRGHLGRVEKNNARNMSESVCFGVLPLHVPNTYETESAIVCKSFPRIKAYRWLFGILLMLSASCIPVTVRHFRFLRSDLVSGHHARGRQSSISGEEQEAEGR